MTTYDHVFGTPFVLLDAPSSDGTPTYLTLSNPAWDGTNNCYTIDYDFGTYAQFYLPDSAVIFTLGWKGSLTTSVVTKTVIPQLVNAHSGTLSFTGSGALTGDSNPLAYYVQVRVENPLTSEGTYVPAKGAGGNMNDNLPFTVSLAYFENDFTEPGFARIDVFGYPDGTIGSGTPVKLSSFYPGDDGVIKTMPAQHGLTVSIQYSNIPAAGGPGNYGPNPTITFRYVAGAGNMAVIAKRIRVVTDVSVGIPVAPPLKSRQASVRARFRQQ